VADEVLSKNKPHLFPGQLDEAKRLVEELRAKFTSAK
jgi:hypothetical protein